MFSTGIPDLDALLKGGFPEKSAILIVGPPGIGKELLVYRFLKSAPPEAKSLYVTRLSVSEVLRDMQAHGIDLEPSSMRWIAAEGSDRRFAPHELATLSFNVKEAIAADGEHSKRVVFDGLSSLLMLNSSDSVYRFLVQLLSELKRYQLCFVTVLEEGMHQPDVVASMEQLFDGVVQMANGDDAENTPFLRLKKMRGLDIRPNLRLELREPPGSPTQSRETRQGSRSRRIAVLPFVNMSPDSGDEFFADGMTEEMIAELSRLPNLGVIARTSAMHYKNSGKRIKEIAKDLGVTAVLEGSIRKSDGRIRITAQLIEAENEEHLWSEKYDRALNDIFEVQEDIARKIAEALRVKLSGVVVNTKGRTENIEAYTFYLKGRALWNTRTKEGVMESLELFKEATKIDPAYARAYAGLADAYSIAANYNFLEQTEGFTKAREAVTKALELDDTLAEAHASLGKILLDNLKFADAVREFRRAIELNPNYASAHHWYSFCLREQGLLGDATEEIWKAHALDPLSPVITDTVAITLALSGKLDDAIAICDKLVKDEPTFALGYGLRSQCWTLLGMKEKAFKDIETYHGLTRNDTEYKLMIAGTHAWFGETARALSLIQDAVKNSDAFVQAADVSECFARLGMKDEFFAWVDKAISINTLYTEWMRYSPFYDKVKDDPRFPEIFKRLGVPY